MNEARLFEIAYHDAGAWVMEGPPSRRNRT